MAVPGSMGKVVCGMAAETRDWRSVRAFVDEGKVRECCTAPADAPEWMRQADAVPYLCLGLPAEPSEGAPFQVFASGWTQLEGVMILSPESAFAADVRASVVATSERALRDLLLAFPRGATGLFYYSAPWALDVLSEVFDGQSLPAREGYYATPESFVPARARPVRRLGERDYEVLRAHWSPEVWREVLADGYTVFAATERDAVEAFCFHWAIDAGRREVHGLQGVRDWTAGYAESVFSAATEDVLARGEVATCTANLAGLPWAEVPLRVGYRRFYTVRQFVGVKRGSGVFDRTTAEAFFFGSPRPVRTRGAETEPRSQAREVDLGTVRALGEAKGRRRHELFVAEGLTLVQRALQDGLPVEAVVYTGQLERNPEGLSVLESAWRAGVPHQRVSDGVMGSLTPSRPVPAVLAVVHARQVDTHHLPLHPGSVLMVAENLQNPDNLGMVVRTADAMGADAVVVAGADPFHRQYVRAARGAVGRIPIRTCGDLAGWLRSLRGDGLRVLGATPHGAGIAYDSALLPPMALAVGNEQDGLSEPTLAACTDRVRIPMAPGQDSLNVGVAAGMLLYEAARQRLVPGVAGTGG